VFVYLDASAIVKLAVAEAETTALERTIAQCRAVFSSKLALVECTRAVARAPGGRRALAPLAEVFEALVLHDVNDLVLARASGIKPTALRSLDAIHLATALLVDAHDLSFVTYDERLARAAETNGLRLVQPK
jgi:predicted nucleic acid-binding protein